MSLIGATAITAGAGLLGAGGNAISQGKMNKRAERFSREMYDKQRGHAVSDWHMQNAYNSPEAQMQRLKEANLNPNLVYGSGSVAQEASTPRGSNASQPNFKAPQLDLGSVVQQAMMTKQIQSNIARTDAETEAIKERTAGDAFKNELNRTIGLERMAENYQWASDKVAIDSQRANAEFEAFKAGTDNYYGKGSMAAKAANAKFHQTIQELENSKQLGDIRRSEAAIKAFEKRLTDQGISPNSPWYTKILGDLLIESGLMPAIKNFIKSD